MSSEDFDDAVEEEMGALEAILMEDVTVLRSGDGRINGVEVCVVPATAQQVSQQHVRCTLVATFPAQYPSVQPKVNIRNPRGIDDSVLQKVEQEMAIKCRECEGSPVIYELVELVRENLTENNTPSCPCTICLYHFHPSDHFTKTHCFHYFHKHCLGRYVKNCELTYAAAVAEQKLAPWQPQPQLQLICPVCREPISVEESVESLLSFPGPAEEENEEQWRPDAPEVLSLRRSMARLFLQQQQRGGIIDLEQEKNKYFVSLMANEPNIEQVSAEESTTEESLENDKKNLTPPRNRSADDEIDAVENQTCPDAVVAGDHADTGSGDRASSSRVIGQQRFGGRGREPQSQGDIRRHGREDKSRGDFRDREEQTRGGAEEQDVKSHHDDQPLDARGRRGRSWYGARGRGYGDGAPVQDGFGRGRRGGSDHHRSRGDHGRGGRGRGAAVRGHRNMGVDAPVYSRSREERLGESSYGRREDEFDYVNGPRQFNRGGYGGSMGRPYNNSRYASNNHHHQQQQQQQPQQHHHQQQYHHYNSNMSGPATQNCYTRFSGRGRNPPRFSKSVVPNPRATADANDCSSASTSQS